MKSNLFLFVDIYRSMVHALSLRGAHKLGFKDGLVGIRWEAP